MPRLIHQDKIAVIELDAEYAALDGDALRQLDQLLAELTAQNTAVCLLLDASATRFVDSNFLEVLIRYWKRISQQGGRLALCNLGPECREVLAATRLDTLWPIFSDREKALEQLARSPGGS